MKTKSALLACCVTSLLMTATPVLAGEWGCYAIANDRSGYSKTFDCPSRAESVAHVLRVCRKDWGISCNLVRCSTGIYTVSDARRKL